MGIMLGKNVNGCLFFALATAGLLGGLARAGSIVANGDFALPPVGGDFTTIPNGPVPADWDVLGAPSGDPVVTSIDHIGTYWVAAPGSTQSLDMNGLNYGVIGQTLNDLNIGETYKLTFELAGNPAGGPPIKTLEADIFTPLPGGSLPIAPTNNAPGDDGMAAIFGTPASASGLFTFDITNHSLMSMGWTAETMDFVAHSSSVYLQFTSRTLADSGNLNYPTAFGPALDNVAVVPVPLPAAAGVGFGMLSICAAWRFGRKKIHVARIV
jgi:hypothetical protein